MSPAAVGHPHRDTRQNAGPAVIDPAGRSSLGLHKAVLTIAGTPVMVRGLSGRRHIVSLFEAAVERIASGRTSRRRSPVGFVKLVLASSGAVANAPIAADQDTLPAVITSSKQARVHRLAEALVKAGTDKEADAVFERYTLLVKALLSGKKRS